MINVSFNQYDNVRSLKTVAHLFFNVKLIDDENGGNLPTLTLGSLDTSNVDFENDRWFSEIPVPMDYIGINNQPVFVGLYENELKLDPNKQLEKLPCNGIEGVDVQLSDGIPKLTTKIRNSGDIRLWRFLRQAGNYTTYSYEWGDTLSVNITSTAIVDRLSVPDDLAFCWIRVIQRLAIKPIITNSTGIIPDSWDLEADILAALGNDGVFLAEHNRVKEFFTELDGSLIEWDDAMLRLRDLSAIYR